MNSPRNLSLPSKLAAAIAMALITACASAPGPKQIDDDQQWRLQGKIGVWHGQQQESASIDWQHCHPQQWRIRLSGPLGAGALEIAAAADGVTLTQGGERRHAASAQQLAAESGWPIPVQALSHWLRGRAAPGRAQQSHISPAGQLLGLQQQGWDIVFQYQAQQQLPQRITARSSTSKVVLMANQWSTSVPLCQTP